MTNNLPVIGFIGNFEAPFSTENDRKWSFEKLGYTVIAFQENKTTIEDLRRHMHDEFYSDPIGIECFDVLFYSHTHGWEIPNLIEFFAECKEKKVPTVSVHLDRWAWLDRVTDVGKEATWFTEYLFMADGSPEAVELYNRHNLNWHYLKPGVVERDCYMAAPDHIKFPHEIVFVGSKGYHHEYPFRPQLIEFLEKTYGDRFGHYGGGSKYGTIRGHDLNVLYASAKIVVGDSCFGGRPYYVSDRYYETRGRGGFLLHPEVEGVDKAGIMFYEKDNLGLLKDAIDLMLTKDSVREEAREVGFQWVKHQETYTNRAEEMLKIIFPL